MYTQLLHLISNACFFILVGVNIEFSYYISSFSVIIGMIRRCLNIDLKNHINFKYRGKTYHNYF